MTETLDSKLARLGLSISRSKGEAVVYATNTPLVDTLVDTPRGPVNIPFNPHVIIHKYDTKLWKDEKEIYQDAAARHTAIQQFWMTSEFCDVANKYVRQ